MKRNTACPFDPAPDEEEEIGREWLAALERGDLRVCEDYLDFIASKLAAAPTVGFDCPPEWLPSALLGFQREGAAWAVRLGRAAFFWDTGLGKTLGQLAWCSAIARHTGRPVLMLAPLAVGPQSVREAEKFGVPDVRVVETQSDVRPGINITNYQKLHHFDPEAFSGIDLDESSILKAFTGKTKQALCRFAESIPFRLCATATPAPNDYLELGNHAEFLGIMPANEMLMRWFINNPAEAGDYRLKKHAEADFWRWVASWACCITRPSDLGYSNDGFILPELRIIEHVAKVEDRDAIEVWSNSQKMTATSIHREMKRTAAVRARIIADLVGAESALPWLIWCNTDYEADAIRAIYTTAVEVRGSHPDKRKIDGLLGFSEGRHRVLITKPKIAGYGLNWQHCCRVAFVGVSYSWEDFYQAVRRCWRFGQTKPVEVHVVCAETETEVLDTLKRKQSQNDEMKAAMVQAVRESWREQHQKRALAVSYESTIERGDGWELRLGDCCQETKKLPDNSVDFTIFSPPFSNLYIYSDSAFDMGNAADDGEFFKHFKYLIPELLRVTVPGRLCAVHCKDLPLYRNRDGASALQDFPAAISAAFTEAGWYFHSRVTIWKCPVTERERTNSHGLLHATALTDSSRLRQGMADYLLVFRKNPTDGTLSAKPIERPAGFEDWPGDPDLDPRKVDVHPSKYARKPGRLPREKTLDDGREVDLTPSVSIWQRLADPVWYHIDQREVLNHQIATAEKDEKHICPLQLGVIREAVYLWTLPGDTVLSPFAGVGSEGYESLKLNRKFIGIELKRSYFDVAVKHLTRAATERANPNLFDATIPEEVAA